MAKTLFLTYADNMEIKTGNRNEDSIRKDFLRRAAREALESDLTPLQKQAVMMYYFEGKNIPRISAELGLNKSTVSRHLSRARERLMKSTDKYLQILGIGQNHS